MKRCQPRMPAKQQKGMLLVEAMVSVLLFSIGILALVGLQASMTRNVTEAKLRGEASFLANELIGQMWVDQGNLSRYAIDADGCVDGLTACSNWLSKVGLLLPGGDAVVTVNGSLVNIAVTWQLSGEMPARFEIGANVTN